MDPLVMAAGGALVGAMATDAWERVRDAVGGWLRSRPVPPGQAHHVSVELEALHSMVVAARREGNIETEEALAGQWRLHLQSLLAQEPALAEGLQQLLDEHLSPVLPAVEQERVRSVVMRGEARDHARLFMSAGDQHFTET